MYGLWDFYFKVLNVSTIRCKISFYQQMHSLLNIQYTHHNLKHMLAQHCTTYNDVFLLITFTKVLL